MTSLYSNIKQEKTHKKLRSILLNQEKKPKKTMLSLPSPLSSFFIYHFPS